MLQWFSCPELDLKPHARTTQMPSCRNRESWTRELLEMVVAFQTMLLVSIARRRTDEPWPKITICSSLPWFLRCLYARAQEQSSPAFQFVDTDMRYSLKKNHVQQTGSGLTAFPLSTAGGNPMVANPSRVSLSVSHLRKANRPFDLLVPHFGPFSPFWAIRSPGPKKAISFYSLALCAEVGRTNSCMAFHQLHSWANSTRGHRAHPTSLEDSLSPRPQRRRRRSWRRQRRPWTTTTRRPWRR